MFKRILRILALLALVLGVSLTLAQNLQATARRYCDPGSDPNWTVQLSKRTMGVGWQYYKNPDPDRIALLHSFWYPPGWRVRTLGTLPVMAARVTSPDGRVGMEFLLGFWSQQITSRQLAEQGINSLMGTLGRRAGAQVLCVNNWPAPVPQQQITALSVLADSTLYFGVATVTYTQGSFLTGPVTLVDYRVVAAPAAQFDQWAWNVLAPWSNSIPRGGQGTACEEGDPDTDRDGVCDHKDLYPNDPRRW
ncbi:MAG: hypothetical protein N2318_06530 [Meiothermus sp.]|nr:hypothetical protein [Meiothermus sp.]